MFSARLVFYVAVIFAGYFSVNAAPVDPKDVQAGRVYRTEPMHFDPPVQGSQQGQTVRHPVVSANNAQGDYAHVVATTSSHPPFPPNMRDHVVPASQYTQHTDKQFTPNTQMAVGNPVYVHADHLRPVGTNAQIPHQLHRTDTEALMRDVYGHDYPHVVAQQAPYNAYRAGHDAAAQAQQHQPPHPQGQFQQHPQGPFPPHPQAGYPPHPQAGYPPHPQAGYPPHPQAGYPPHPQAGYPPHPQAGYPPHPQAGYPPHPPAGYPPHPPAGYPPHPPPGHGWGH